MGVSIDLEIREQREDLDLSTQGEGRPTTTSLASSLTSVLVGTSLEPIYPSTISPTIDMIMIYRVFL